MRRPILAAALVVGGCAPLVSDPTAAVYLTMPLLSLKRTRISAPVI